MKKLLFFIALSFTVSASAFSEFSYMLEPQEFSWSAVLFSSVDCSQFKRELLLPSGIPLRKEFQESYFLAQEAKQSLSRAGTIAKIQEFYWGSPAVQKPLSVLCFGYAQDALDAASVSARLGLNSVDANLVELEKRFDPTYAGLAGGVSEEVSEARKDVLDGKTGAASLGQKLVGARDSLKTVWDTKNFLEVVAALVGTDSLLKSEIVLNEKIVEATRAMDEEYAAMADHAREEMILVESVLQELREENLYLVGENALLFLESKGVLSSGYTGAFYEELRSSEAGCREVKKLFDEARTVAGGKESGSLARGIVLLRKVYAMERDLLDRVERVLAKSTELEAALEEKFGEEYAALEKKANAVKGTNPVASAIALDLLSDAMRLGGGKTRGERINGLLKQLAKLEEAKLVLESSRPVAERKNRVLALFSETLSLVKRAGNDFETDSFEARLARVENAVNGIGESESDLGALRTAESELDELKKDVLEKAESEYGFLEKQFPSVVAAKEFLETDWREKISLQENYFEQGRVVWEKALGKLAEIRKVFSGALAEMDARKPGILKKHLQDNMRAERIVGLAEIGEPAEITEKIFLHNALELDYNGTIALDAPFLDGFVALEKSAEISFNANKIFLSSVEAGEDYYIVAEKKAVVARKTSEKTETLYANQYSAEERIEIRFSADEDAPVLIEFGGEFLVETNAAFESGEGRIVFNALKGENSLAVRRKITEPAEVTKRVYSEGNALVLEYSVSPKTDLSNLEILFSERISCVPKKVDFSGVDSSDYKLLGETLVGKMVFKKVFAAQEKKATMVVECDSFQAAAEEKLLELEVRAKQSGINVASELTEATAEMGEGNFLDALKKLYAVEREVEEREAKNLEAEERKQTILGKIGETEKEIALFEEAAAELKSGGEADAFLEVTGVVLRSRKALGDAKEKVGNGLFDDAERVLESVENDVSGIARFVGEKISVLEKSCKTGCGEAEALVLEARKEFALGKNAEALKAVLAAEKEITLAKEWEKNDFEEKKKLLADFGELKESAEKTIEEAGQAFSSETTQRNALKDEAGREQKKVEDALKKLESAWNALETGGGLEKISLDYLTAQKNAAEEGLQKLSGLVAQMKEKAGQEIAVAKGKQKQFGSEGTSKTLQDSLTGFEEGHYLSAYLLASSLNQKLPAETVAVGGFEWRELLLGTAGAIILLLFLVLFLRKPGKSFREVE